MWGNDERLKVSVWSTLFCGESVLFKFIYIYMIYKNLYCHDYRIIQMCIWCWNLYQVVKCSHIWEESVDLGERERWGREGGRARERESSITCTYIGNILFCLLLFRLLLIGLNQIDLPLCTPVCNLLFSVITKWYYIISLGLWNISRHEAIECLCKTHF